MVCLRTQKCIECGKVTQHFNGKCGDCESRKQAKAYRIHFAGLKGLTLEERIERLEKWQYQMQQNPPWIEAVY